MSTSYSQSLMISSVMSSNEDTPCLFNKDALNKQITHIEKYIRFMKEIVKNNYFDDHPKPEALSDTYPLIFMVNNPEIVVIIDDFPIEYFAKEPVRLGKDIEIIATDTLAHQKKLNLFIDTNREPIGGDVTTCLFEDLLEINKKSFTSDEFKKHANEKYAERLTKPEIKKCVDKKTEKLSELN